MSNWEAVFMAKNGSEITTLLSAVVMKDPDLNVTGIVCVVRDITDHKLAEDQLTGISHMDHAETVPGLESCPL
jgi:PAS domain S-box-containing protein